MCFPSPFLYLLGGNLGNLVSKEGKAKEQEKPFFLLEELSRDVTNHIKKGGIGREGPTTSNWIAGSGMRRELYVAPHTSVSIFLVKISDVFNPTEKALQRTVCAKEISISDDH